MCSIELISGNSPQHSDSEDTESPQKCDSEMYKISIDKINRFCAELLEQIDVRLQVEKCTGTVNDEINSLGIQNPSISLNWKISHVTIHL